MNAAINVLQRELRALERLLEAVRIEENLTASGGVQKAELLANRHAIIREHGEIRDALTAIFKAQTAKQRPHREDEA